MPHSDLRLFYGCVVLKRGDSEQTGLQLLFASHLGQANEIATTSAKKRHPGWRVDSVRMRQVPDSAIRQAGEYLGSTLGLLEKLFGAGKGPFG